MIWISIVIASLVALIATAYLAQHRLQWREQTPHTKPLIYLEAGMAVRPTVLGHALPEPYRLACLFFGTGLIDRTATLDHGFPYKVLDPIPDLSDNAGDIAAICETRASELAELSRAANRPIRLFWSGGIDSTAACVALLKALQDEPDRLQIAYSSRSVSEYRLFYKRYVKPHPIKKKIGVIQDALDSDYILTSGEHGDQLFGSVKALTMPFKMLNQDWQNAFPEMLNAQFASPGRTDAVMNYLQPQFAKCPIPIPTLFDLLWWMNFSLKWQAVSLRMLTPLKTDEFRPTQSKLQHFFQTTAFQQWSLANPDKRIKNNLTSYKWPLKEYILGYTGDKKYFRQKEKEPSLKGLLARRKYDLTLAIDERRNFFYQRPDKSLKDRNNSDQGFEVEFSYEREKELWKDCGDGE